MECGSDLSATMIRVLRPPSFLSPGADASSLALALERATAPRLRGCVAALSERIEVRTVSGPVASQAIMGKWRIENGCEIAAVANRRYNS